MNSARAPRAMMGPSQGEEPHVARFTVSPGPWTRAQRLALEEPRARAGRHNLRTRIAFRHARGFLGGRRLDARECCAPAAKGGWPNPRNLLIGAALAGGAGMPALGRDRAGAAGVASIVKARE